MNTLEIYDQLLQGGAGVGIVNVMRHMTCYVKTRHQQNRKYITRRTQAQQQLTCLYRIFGSLTSVLEICKQADREDIQTDRQT